MKKKNKYKGKKYKKPLDNYLSEYTSLDNGGTIKRANDSIRKYVTGTTIEPTDEDLANAFGTILNSSGNLVNKGSMGIIPTENFQGPTSSINQGGGFDKFLSNLQGSDLGNALGQFGASATLGLSSAAVQNLINVAMGGGDNFEGMRPQFTGATKQFEDGGKIVPPDFSRGNVSQIEYDKSSLNFANNIRKKFGDDVYMKIAQSVPLPGVDYEIGTEEVYKDSTQAERSPYGNFVSTSNPIYENIPVLRLKGTENVIPQIFHTKPNSLNFITNTKNNAVKARKLLQDDKKHIKYLAKQFSKNPDFEYKQGGKIEYPNKGLEKLSKIVPDVVEKMEFEDGGVIPENNNPNSVIPGIPSFAKQKTLSGDNKVPYAPESGTEKILQAFTSGIKTGASNLNKKNVESLSNTPEEERIYKHRSDGFSTSKQKIKNVEKYSTLLNKYAQRDGINLNELQSIMAIESGGVPTATSGAAFGLMQITKNTWEGITKRREEENKERIKKGLEPLPTYKFTKANWSDPEKNIDYGSETFGRKYKSLNTYGVPSNHPLRGALATTMYNVGPGTLKASIEAAKAAGSDDPFADALNPKYLSKGVEKTEIYKYYLTGRGKKRNKHFDEEGNLKEGSTMKQAKEEAITLKTKEGSTYAPKFSTYNKNFFQPYYGNEENIAALKNGGPVNKQYFQNLQRQLKEDINRGSIPSANINNKSISSSVDFTGTGASGNVSTGLGPLDLNLSGDINLLNYGVLNEGMLNPNLNVDASYSTPFQGLSISGSASDLTNNPQLGVGASYSNKGTDANINYDITNKNLSAGFNRKGLGAYLNIPMSDPSMTTADLSYNTKIKPGQNLGINVGLSKDPTANITYTSDLQKRKQQPKKLFRDGGMVEVEGGEAYETPNGEVGEFVGPDHSEGGIKMEVGDKNDDMVDYGNALNFANKLDESNLVDKGSKGIVPEGTEVYSKRISKDGKNMAKRKLERENYIVSLEKKLEENPMDPLLLATYNRAKETMGIADNADKRIQEEVRAMENIQGLEKYLAKYGGKMKREMYGYGGMMKYPGGGMVKELEFDVVDEFGKGGYIVKRSNARKGKTHVVIRKSDGKKEYYGYPGMGTRGKSKHGKKAFYARHAKNLKNNPFFRAYARATWEMGGMITDDMYAKGGTIKLDPAKKGTFKALATKYDMSMDDLAMDMKNNPDNYSPEARKKANFYRNFVMEMGGKVDFDDIPMYQTGTTIYPPINPLLVQAAAQQVRENQGFDVVDKDDPYKGTSIAGQQFDVVDYGAIPNLVDFKGLDPSMMQPVEDPKLSTAYVDINAQMPTNKQGTLQGQGAEYLSMPINFVDLNTQIPIGAKGTLPGGSVSKTVTNAPITETTKFSSTTTDPETQTQKTTETELVTDPIAKTTTTDTTTTDGTGYDLTMGDYLGLAGVGISGIAPLATTLASRLTDRPNVNMMKNVGLEALATMEGQKGFLGQQFKQQEAKIGEMARNANRRYQGTARSVNQARAGFLISDMQAQKMLQGAYANYAQQMLGIESQIANLEFQADKIRSAGKQAADLANRQDVDNFFTNLNQDLVNLGTAMQAGAKALNVKELDKQINSMMTLLSPYGIGVRKDGKGGHEFYNVVTGKTKTLEETQADLRQARQEKIEEVEEKNKDK